MMTIPTMIWMLSGYLGIAEWKRGNKKGIRQEDIDRRKYKHGVHRRIDVASMEFMASRIA